MLDRSLDFRQLLIQPTTPVCLRGSERAEHQDVHVLLELARLLTVTNEPRMVLLWYFRVPLFGSRPSEMQSSQVREPREMGCPAFRAINTSRPEAGTQVAHKCGGNQNFIGDLRGATDEESQ
jgi:hypothetical protein